MKARLLIGCSGSVASVKIPELVAELCDTFEILVVATSNSYHFLECAKQYNPTAWERFEKLGGFKLVIFDEDEWISWNKLGDPVIHIELRKWADLLLIAPASANLIASASIGACSNLLLSVIRAWDFNKPCILCPAMNTVMWEHPATEVALNILRGWGWQTVGPIEKLLACNERGNGAMSSVNEITSYLTEMKVNVNSFEDRALSDSLSKLIAGKQRTSRRESIDDVNDAPLISSPDGRFWNMVMFVSVGIVLGFTFERIFK